MTINICLATDENYLKYMATTMVSILASSNRNDNLSFYILCNNISNDSKKYIENLKRFKDFKINFIDMDIKDFADFPAGGPHISNTTYYRYKIADICKDIDKIIYLDCDMIIKSSLQELFDEDISNYLLGGVEDVGYYYWKDKNPDFKCKGFYINAGMLLINLDAWRKENIGDKLMQYTAEHHNEIIIGDQDVINTVCKNKIKPLKYSYNVQDSFYRTKLEVYENPNRNEIVSASLKPTILHYTNTRKPWDDFTMNRSKDWYYTYLLMTNCDCNDILRMKILIYLYENLLTNNLPKKNILSKLFSIKKEFSNFKKRIIITFFGLKLKIKTKEYKYVKK